MRRNTWTYALCLFTLFVCFSVTAQASEEVRPDKIWEIDLGAQISEDSLEGIYVINAKGEILEQAIVTSEDNPNIVLVYPPEGGYIAGFFNLVIGEPIDINGNTIDIPDLISFNIPLAAYLEYRYKTREEKTSLDPTDNEDGFPKIKIMEY